MPQTVKDEMKPRSPSESMVETNHIVLGSHANAVGTIFGGVLMSWIDITAAICAQRHSRKVAVTASVDTLYFLAPARVGDTVTLRAKVEATGKSSMVVSVEVVAENPRIGDKRRCVTAHLTFVALDASMKPTPVPPLLLKTPEEKKASKAAAERRKFLLAELKKQEPEGRGRSS